MKIIPPSPNSLFLSIISFTKVPRYPKKLIWQKFRFYFAIYIFEGSTIRAGNSKKYCLTCPFGEVRAQEQIIFKIHRTFFLVILLQLSETLSKASR